MHSGHQPACSQAVQSGVDGRPSPGSGSQVRRQDRVGGCDGCCVGLRVSVAPPYVLQGISRIRWGGDVLHWFRGGSGSPVRATRCGLRVLGGTSPSGCRATRSAAGSPSRGCSGGGRIPAGWATGASSFRCALFVSPHGLTFCSPSGSPISGLSAIGGDPCPLRLGEGGRCRCVSLWSLLWLPGPRGDTACGTVSFWSFRCAPVRVWCGEPSACTGRLPVCCSKCTVLILVGGPRSTPAGWSPLVQLLPLVFCGRRECSTFSWSCPVSPVRLRNLCSSVASASAPSLSGSVLAIGWGRPAPCRARPLCGRATASRWGGEQG